MFTNVVLVITFLLIGSVTNNDKINIIDVRNDSEKYLENCSTQVEEIKIDNGNHLTPTRGVYYFGNQKETYYNLDMSYVVEIAHNRGIEGEYYIRTDGCKMLGDYIMIAANQNIHPYGSLVETSLGTGIVVDTGGFAVNNPLQVDIAVSW